MLLLSSPKGLKNAKWPFSVIKGISLKKVCYKVSLREYSQRQSGKALTGLSIRAKNGSWGNSPYT